MLTGISTACFYPNTIEDSLIKVCETNSQCTELFFNTQSELEINFLHELKKCADESNLLVTSIHPYTSSFEPFLFFTSYERRFRDSLELYNKYFETACILGADVVVFHGDRAGGTIEEEDYFERYGVLQLAARSFGIELAQENVARCRSGSIDFIRHMKEYLGDTVSFVFDIKQAVRSNTDPLQVFQAMDGRIVHLHISDNNQQFDCLPPGLGDFDFTMLLQLLNSADLKNDPALMIELYQSNYEGIWELNESLKYIQNRIK